MKYGYARVSTDDQNPALQLAALKAGRMQNRFKDEGSRERRPNVLLCSDGCRRPEARWFGICGLLTLDKMYHFVDTDRDDRPVGAGLKGFRKQELSTKCAPSAQATFRRRPSTTGIAIGAGS
jgi:hypothetical protein